MTTERWLLEEDRKKHPSLSPHSKPRLDPSVDVTHLQVFEYTSSNFQTPVNIFSFRLCDAIEQVNTEVINI